MAERVRRVQKVAGFAQPSDGKNSAADKVSRKDFAVAPQGHPRLGLHGLLDLLVYAFLARLVGALSRPWAIQQSIRGHPRPGMAVRHEHSALLA